MAPKLSERIEQEKHKGVTWNEVQMTTGIPEIDAQHKKWIARFNEFRQAIINQKGEEACTNALLFFMRYTETHFRFEEAMMEQYHCSANALNKDEHKKFQDRIQEITYMTWPLGATMEDVKALEAELVGWLTNHICCVDVKLRDCV
jgi:hemerythrin